MHIFESYLIQKGINEVSDFINDAFSYCRSV